MEASETVKKASSSRIVESERVKGQESVFAFWLYLVGLISGIAVALTLISSLLFNDDSFSSMPDDIRFHLSNGKFIKVDVGPDQQPIKVFVRQEGPSDGPCVFLVHGFGASSFLYRQIIPQLASQRMHVVAIDHPGFGLSDKTTLEASKGHGFISRFREIWDEIAEKGLLWRFEELFETGQFPNLGVAKHRTERRALSLSAQDLSNCIDQVMGFLVLPAVHLVLHETGVQTGLLWAADNPSRVLGITLIDTVSHPLLLPSWIFRMPVVRHITPRSKFLHWLLLRACCTRKISLRIAEAHAFLLRRDAGVEAMVQMWQRMNMSFNIAAILEDLRDVPLQILWSSSWGKKWEKEGEILAAQLPRATFSSHYGSLWPQEDAAAEIAKGIQDFVSSLPSTRQSKHLRDNAHRLDEASDNCQQLSSHEHNENRFCSHGFGISDTDGFNDSGCFM